ncbi:MAG TPA: iron ABC transporter permease, partial [Paenibacillus cookii]|nr:iron ABC transporter permease [Paenibacillus cookii]
MSKPEPQLKPPTIRPVSRWNSVTTSPHFVYVLIAPLFLILLGYVIYPFFQTFLQSVKTDGSFSLQNYSRFFSLEHTANLEALWTSV